MAERARRRQGAGRAQLAFGTSGGLEARGHLGVERFLWAAGLPSVARHLKVLPYAVISTGSLLGGGVPPAPAGEKCSIRRTTAGLTDQQLAASERATSSSSGTESSTPAAWLSSTTYPALGRGPDNRADHALQHPVSIQGPTFRTTRDGSTRGIRDRSAAGPTRECSPRRQIRESSAAGLRASELANNSGIIGHAQFSDGGFGDIGLQWRHVSVSGSVAVVHNTLAVNESADLPAGDIPGPITFNVTFNSGALSGGLSRQHNQIIVSPPSLSERKSTRPVNPGKALPSIPRVRNNATNTGILGGGQLTQGGANHALLQWQCVKVDGKVTVMDNVLSISVLDRPSAPITISNVTFA